MQHSRLARDCSRVLCGALLLALAPLVPAQVLVKNLTYTRFAGTPNVRQVVFTYDATLGTTSFGAPTTVTTTPGADGVLFAPDGQIIVGGQADAVYRINPGTGAFTTATTGGAQSFHVMLDPLGTKVWTAGIPGFLASVPLYPFANGTPHLLSGDDPFVTHLAFANGKAYYTASFASGLGNFGLIDLNTFTTTRLQTLVPWAHGMAYDCYTKKVVVFANNTVAQIDPVTDAVISVLNIPAPPLQMDQGTSDGNGHLYIASNSGDMVFIDMTVSQLVGSPDFVDVIFLEAGLDDLAPDCGLGAPPALSYSHGYWKNHPNNWPVQSLTLGCQTYTKAQCIALMSMPVKGDASLILVYQLIAAKLNLANNGLNWPEYLPLINQADALLCTYGGLLPYRVKSTSTNGQLMTSIGGQLDTFWR